MRFPNKKAALAVGCLALALVVLAPPLTRGDEWNLATKFDVNHSFEVPGMVLQPNTKYVIRLLDSVSNRNVVQIYNEDQTNMLTMFMAISDERFEALDKTQFTFIEMQPQHPLPIKEWFYPGRLRGLEFVYPKDQAMKIAQHARESVLASDSNDLSNLASIKIEAIEPRGDRAPVVSSAKVTQAETPAVQEPLVQEPAVTEESEVAVAQPAPAIEEPAPQVEQPVEEERPAQIAQNTQPEPIQPQVQEPQQSSQAPEVRESEQELPRTAGELPLIALLGVLCLGAGLGLKVLSARS